MKIFMICLARMTRSNIKYNTTQTYNVLIISPRKKTESEAREATVTGSDQYTSWKKVRI